MDLAQLLSILEDRYTELYVLMGSDESKSLDWYDGAMDETKRTIGLIKRHLTSQPSGEEHVTPLGDEGEW